MPYGACAVEIVALEHSHLTSTHMKYTDKRQTAVKDTECYRDYWSIAFRCVDTKKTVLIEFYEGMPLDRKRIATILRNWRVVSFNGIKYDLPMIMLAMREGTTNEELKQASDEIILTNMQPWQFYEKHDLVVPDFIDHIDLMEVNPGSPTKPSLKLCGGRLHSRRLQELPFDPSETIGPTQRAVMRSYLGNDLETTIDMFNELRPQLDLRAVMSDQYGVDLRSKSDAQIAEAVIKSEVERISGRRLYKPEVKPHTFLYVPPPFVRYETPMMREMLHTIKRTPFVVDSRGIVEMPEYLSKLKIEIGQSAYKMGIGGLHSTEESITHIATDEIEIVDRDVTSYYPKNIENQRLYPKHIGEVFLRVYSTLIRDRIAAKKAGKKNIAESLKIVLNGSFGKFGSPYSVLYSPNLMIQTTITGQLSILMLIEQLEAAGIQVISANTDGIVSKVPKSLRWKFDEIFFDWEWATGFLTEETKYSGLYSSSVNTYLAVKPNGSVKSKGSVSEGGPGMPGAAGLKKNPNGEISAIAVREFLSKKTPIEQTIENCHDVRKFVVVRRVTGGAKKDGEFIGKVVRYYFSSASHTPLLYVKNDNKVPRSDGAVPMMDLPEGNVCPDDLDRSHYIREAYAILQDVGFGAFDPSLRGRSGTFLARLPSAKNIHSVSATTGIAACGKERASIRETWVEFPSIPMGHRMCAACRKAEGREL